MTLLVFPSFFPMLCEEKIGSLNPPETGQVFLGIMRIDK
jgi:hypothetical protein